MPSGRVKVFAFIILLSHFTLLQRALAEESPIIELGIGLAGADLPHYRGSNQRRSYYAPFPYIRYEGKRLKINRDGGQFYFFENPEIKIDLSAALAPPVYSRENDARSGMDDLDPVIELGPRLQFAIYESPGGRFAVSAAFPLRMAFATDIINTDRAGAVFSPYILFHLNHSLDFDLSAGPIWGDERYNDYIYEVEEKYAAPNRPAYDAKGGYSGSRITFSTGRRYDGYWFGFFARYDSLSGAVF